MAEQSPILTVELARRIERVVVREKLGMLEPGKSHVGQFGQTAAIKVPGQPWLNAIFCFSHEDVSRLDEIVAFYTQDELKPNLYLAPMGVTHDVTKALTRAGFRPDEFNQAMLYGVPGDETGASTGEVVVERVTAQTLETYAQVNVDGFDYPAAWHENIKSDLQRQFESRAGFHAFLARYRGEPAGSAHLSAPDETASLGGSSVIEKFRGKGCHAALLRERSRTAAELGCNLIVGGARFGSASFRNQQRFGLRVAYVESAWKIE